MSERHKALTEAWQAVQREVVPLGGYSPWNEGFTTAVNKALNAILALRDAPPSTERLPHADVPGLTPETCPERDAHGNPFRMCPVKGCGWHEGMDRHEP